MFSRAKLLIVSGLGLALAGINSAMAYTVDAVTGFPKVEATDTSTMLSGVGSAGAGMLDFVTSQWKVVISIIVIGSVISMVYSFLGKTKSAVHGR
jgi:hypothetical protein